MILAVALLPLAAAAASEDLAEPEPYPAREVLAAFATACSGIEAIPVAQASVRAAGWEQVEPAADSAIARIVKVGEDMMARQDPSVDILDGGIWRKNVAGRELFTVISGVQMEGIASSGCRVYDLAAPAALAEEDLRDWAVRDPQDAGSTIPGSARFFWNPGLKPGHIEMEISFVPQGAKLPEPLADIPLSGLIFTASAVEFSDL
ncbi:MAG: hypothetical protein BGO57_00690 [Sphingomonadales bacterium 63-6]|nr:MAG: hypothetical protein BGO57_00690 [Sphingomonadales bacterium 63-6]